MKRIPTFQEMRDKAPEEIQDLLKQCADTKQSKNWHPEGDVLKHIRIVYHRARKTGDLDLTIAAFFHDLGKVKTTKPNGRGGWGAHGHEFVSSKLVDRYKDWIKEIGGNHRKVKELVFQHMRIKQWDKMREHKRQGLRENPYFEDLKIFTECDNMKTLTDEEMKI